MGEKSGVEWCDHSFSINWGCEQVPQVNGLPSACDNCYAKTLSERWKFDVWGKDKPRRMLSEHHWNEPFRWNRKAEKAKERKRVFCGPMNDICEDRRDLDPLRERLIAIIEQTPWLDWMLLTKRPFLYKRFFPWKVWPKNAWAGTTTEHQYWFDHRMKALKEVPAEVHFVSAEPLFTPIDISAHLKDLQWVITGTESGIKARMGTQESWIRSLKDQCVGAGIPFFYKQWTVPIPTMPFNKVIPTPELDGRIWVEFPKSPAGQAA